MGFDKPQPLVNAAGNLGEQIRRVGVVQFVRFIDGVANFLPESGQWPVLATSPDSR